MVAWALRQAGVRRIVAECDADNLASMRVLEKVGFGQIGAAGDTLRWEWKETRE